MFDPYHRWLAIPPEQRPPTYYQLLGITPNEHDPEVIKEAALRQASHVRTYQIGPHARECTTLLNEIGQARATLLNPAKRREYDARLLPTDPAAGISGPPPVPGLDSSSVSADDAFRFTAMPDQPRRSAPRQRPFWAEPVLLLYLVLLCLGGGLAFLAARRVHVDAVRSGQLSPDVAFRSVLARSASEGHNNPRLRFGLTQPGQQPNLYVGAGS